MNEYLKRAALVDRLVTSSIYGLIIEVSQYFKYIFSTLFIFYKLTSYFIFFKLYTFNSVK